MSGRFINKSCDFNGEYQITLDVAAPDAELNGVQVGRDGLGPQRRGLVLQQLVEGRTFFGDFHCARPTFLFFLIIKTGTTARRSEKEKNAWNLFY